MADANFQGMRDGSRDNGGPPVASAQPYLTGNQIAVRSALLWIGVAPLLLMLFSGFDVWAHEAVRSLDPEFRQTMRRWTDVGKSDWMLIGTAVIIGLFWRLTHDTDDPGWQEIINHYAGRFVFIFAAVAGAGITAMLLKGIIGRARPKLFETEGVLAFDPFVFTSKWASFPSGHTTNIIALAAALTAIWPRLGYILMPFAVLIAITRILVGAHHPTDVVAGTLLALLFVLSLRAILADRNILFKRTEHGGITLQHRWAGEA